MILDFTEARDGQQLHQLDHMQIICTSFQTDDHASTSSLSFYRPNAFLSPNQQCQSTECKKALKANPRQKICN